MNEQNSTSTNQRKTVRDAYGAIAKSGGSCCGSGSSCCGSSSPDMLSEAIGYSENELAGVPDAANMGLSCGNPTASDALRPGQTVLDLGCGGGFDVFIAAKKVGPDGHVIGVDMTPAMIDRARANAGVFSAQTGLENVEIRLGEIEHLPVADNTIDVVISNCVINLSPDKPQVWREIARVLKPGGYVSISDLALEIPLPDNVRASVEALVGCIAGAVLISETERMIAAAGLMIESIERHPGYVKSMADLQDPLYRQIADELPGNAHIADYISSITVRVFKPE